MNYLNSNPIKDKKLASALLDAANNFNQKQ